VEISTKGKEHYTFSVQ